MKICMISSSYPRFAGDFAASTLRSMAIAIAKRGHRIDVVAPYDPLVEAYSDEGVRVHRFRYAPSDRLCLGGHGRSLSADERLKPLVPLLMPTYALSCLWSVLRLHRHERFDVFHGHWGIPSGTIAAVASYLTGVPLIVSLHGGGDVCLMANSRLLAAAGRIGFRRATEVTVFSHEMLTSARTLGLSGGQVVPQGVDTPRFCAGCGDRLRHSLGIPDEAPVVGSLGRLTRMKGFGHLVGAMPEILAQVPDAYCVIGGDGDLRDEILRLAADRGVAERVRLAGHVAWYETPDLYALCDVMVVPSIVSDNGNVDGLPSVLLEAMASAKPVVASRVAGIPDVICHEDNGLLCSPGDEAALAAGVCQLLQDKERARAIGLRGQQTMVESYDWQRTARSMEELYLRAVRSSHGISKAAYDGSAQADRA